MKEICVGESKDFIVSESVFVIYKHSKITQIVHMAVVKDNQY